MARTPEQQFRSLISEKHHILICLPEKNPSLDAVTSGMALASLFKNQNKTFKIVSSAFTPSHHLSMFNSCDIAASLPQNLHSFVVTLNIANMGVQTLHYDIVDDQLSIFITPQKQVIEPVETFISSRAFSFDLIITLDIQELTQLGSIFQEHPDFFYHTPIANIDHNPENEHFGSVNLVDITATSNAEILLHALGVSTQTLDKEIATLFLAGIISKTNAFRNRITPRALTLTSRLLAQGARFSEIVQGLYYKKSFASMKLWGEVLRKFSFDPHSRMISVLIGEEDFVKTSSQPCDLAGLIDELMMHVPEASSILIIYTQEEGCEALLHVPHAMRSQTQILFAPYSPRGSGHLLTLTLPEKDPQRAYQLITPIIHKYFHIA